MFFVKDTFNHINKKQNICEIKTNLHEYPLFVYKESLTCFNDTRIKTQKKITTTLKIGTTQEKKTRRNDDLCLKWHYAQLRINGM